VAEVPADPEAEVLALHRQRIRQAAELKEAIRRQADLVANGYEADPPDHLLRLVGPVPEEGRRAWREAASAVASYRARWGVRDVDDALGRAPTMSAQSAQLAHVRRSAALVVSSELSGQERESGEGMSLGL
jgi:NADPH-dependent glutamate synthase beta subunit-like oxidoreductase